MKKLYFVLMFAALNIQGAMSQNTVIDFSANNTSSDYVTYDKSISLPAGKTVDVKMARYCYFTSKITGKGTLNLYAGGERCYIGTKSGSSWADWSNYSGDVDVWPYKENCPNAGFWGIVLAHGGKQFSPEKIEDCIKNGKLNNAMQNNRVTLHEGATICTEANSTNAGGFRIGELQTEAGSTLLGYMKTKRKSYYLLGCLNTDATLAGTIAPSSNDASTILGIIKEGTGTYRITGNQNFLSGALRIIGGRVLVNNDRAAAESSKLSGGLGAMTDENTPVAYVFTGGVLGGTGSIGGAVDNYGTIEPGDDAIGLLTLKNYATTSKNAHLFVHPASKLRFKVKSTENHDQLNVGGTVKYSNTTEDFSESDAMPMVQVVVDEEAAVSVGDEFVVLTAKTKTSQSGDWHFELQKPEKYTWELEERETDGQYQLVLRLVSLKDQEDPDNPDNPDNPDEEGMGAFYDDGIDDNADSNTLRYYAEKNDKFVGVAMCTYKGYDSERNEAAKQFNIMVAENEMKMDALQPSRGSFSFGSADQLVSLAQRNKMAVRGHCLVWHQQQPTWLSSDGKKNDKNWSREEALEIMKKHITTVMQHFKGKVTEWDVVNECLDDDQSIIRTNPDAYTLRSNVWRVAIGDDYIDSAFVYARRADPSAQLYLNDYDVELQGKAKAVAYYNLAMRLKERGIPLDGVGLQCHFSIGDVDSLKLDKTIRRFGDADLKCIITELDMGIPSTSAANLEEQARNYRVITDVMLNNDNCPSMLIWGIKDNDSWRSGSNPLLYTSSMSKKPAWYAVRSALRHRTLGTYVSIGSARSDCTTSDAVYSLQGIKVGATKGWSQLPHGLYIVNGKIIKK